MKIFMLGTIGGYMNSEYAACQTQDWINTYAPNNFSWWKWGAVCPNCKATAEVPIIPWQMRWLEGSKQFGDIAGTGFPCWNIIVQKKIIDFFENNNYFVSRFDVSFEVISPPSKKSRALVYPRVQTMPYTGHPFWGIRPRYGVHINEEKSHKTRILSCSVCGKIRYDTENDFFWNNFVIDEEEWNGLKLFGIFEFGSFLDTGDGLFLSEEGKDILIRQGFTNINCQEVGRIEKLGTGIMKPYRETADYDFWKPEEYLESPVQPKKKKTQKK